MECYINFSFHAGKKFDESSNILYFKQIFEIYTEIKTTDWQLHKVIITHKEYCVMVFVHVLILQKKI